MLSLHVISGGDNDSRGGRVRNDRIRPALRNVDHLSGREIGMLERVRSSLRAAWPLLGSVYLLYLALQPPPVRYVGLGGLVIVTPLLLGWALGRLFGVGPWTDTGPSD